MGLKKEPTWGLEISKLCLSFLMTHSLIKKQMHIPSYLKIQYRGTWVAQWVKTPTLDLGSGLQN